MSVDGPEPQPGDGPDYHMEHAFWMQRKRIPDPLPKHPTADDVYYISGAWAPSCITAKEKRFTDAELAAEYWRKVGDYDACTEGYGTAMDGYNYESEEVEEGRMTTFLRFHSLPHYDEDDS